MPVVKAWLYIFFNEEDPPKRVSVCVVVKLHSVSSEAPSSSDSSSVFFRIFWFFANRPQIDNSFWLLPRGSPTFFVLDQARFDNLHLEPRIGIFVLRISIEAILCNQELGSDTEVEEIVHEAAETAVLAEARFVHHEFPDREAVTHIDLDIGVLATRAPLAEAEAIAIATLIESDFLAKLGFILLEEASESGIDLANVHIAPGLTLDGELVILNRDNEACPSRIRPSATLAVLDDKESPKIFHSVLLSAALPLQNRV